MNTITPEYIRSKQEENILQLSIKVDKIMKPYLNDMVCNGRAYVRNKDTRIEGISTDDFRDELRRRGFVVQYEGRYSEVETIIVSLPPDGE